jgi:Flp pilus assembly protein TadB
MKKYKYKLNMLEPGWKMLKMIGIFGVLGFGFYIIKILLLCYIFSGLAALLGIVLWILLVVESHQDKTLNEQAIQERKKNGEY